VELSVAGAQFRYAQLDVPNTGRKAVTLNSHAENYFLNKLFLSWKLLGLCRGTPQWIEAQG